jgi:6-phosphogluconolactonase
MLPRAVSPSAVTIIRMHIWSRQIRRDALYCMSTWDSTRSSFRNSTTGRHSYSARARKPFHCRPATGRDTFHSIPNGHWLYCIQEEGSTIVLFDYEPANGTLTARQTISSLPPGFAGSNFCSEILVSSDGRFVYAGNRLHDSIAVFSVGQDGRLTFVSDEPTRGNYPRSFNFDPTGKFLYSCNQRGDNITVFKVDGPSGQLIFTGQYVPVGNPSCIVFLDLSR